MPAIKGNHLLAGMLSARWQVRSKIQPLLCDYNKHVGQYNIPCKKFSAFSGTWNCREPPKKVCDEKFELWVMLSLCISHVATVASPFRDFPFMKRKIVKLSLLHKNVNMSSHRKGNLMALTAVYQIELWLKVQDMPSKLSLPRQGPWNLVWVKQVFELSVFQCNIPCKKFSAYSG